MLPSNCLDGGAGDFRNFLDCARPALALDPGLLLIGDSDDCDVGLLLGGPHPVEVARSLHHLLRPAFHLARDMHQERPDDC